MQNVKENNSNDSCADYDWMVGPYLDGELPQGERNGLEDHMNTCSQCSSLAEQFRNLDRLARTAAAPTPKVSAEEWGELWESIQKQSASLPIGHTSLVDHTSRNRDWLVPLLSAAALLIVGLWIGFSLLTNTQVENSDPDVVKNPEDPIKKMDDDPAVIIDDDVYIIHYDG